MRHGGVARDRVRRTTHHQCSRRAWHHAAVPKPKASKRVASPKRAASPDPTKPTKPTKPAARKQPVRASAKPTTTKAAGKKPAGRKPAAKQPVMARRVDFGAPIAGFFAKQPKPLRPILEALRDLVQEAAPDAASSLKWGMPFFMIGDAMMCALGGHKSHVNLILSGPPGTYADPEGRLSGDGKTGRHLKLTAADQIPRDAVRGWLKTAAKRARANP
jgi:hypothetical protein